MSGLSQTRKVLIRALTGLPSIEEYDAVLKAGGLPVDDRTRTICENKILEIREKYESRVSSQNRPDTSKVRARLARKLGDLHRELQSDEARQELGGMAALDVALRAHQVLGGLAESGVVPPARQAVENTAKPGVVPLGVVFPSFNVSKYIEDTEMLHNDMMIRIYTGAKTRNRIKRRHLDLENWFFEELYHLYGRLNGAPPGNSIGGPLYRFTMEAAKLVGIKVVITPGAFRKRRNDLSERWRKGLEMLAAVQ